VNGWQYFEKEKGMKLIALIFVCIVGVTGCTSPSSDSTNTTSHSQADKTVPGIYTESDGLLLMDAEHTETTDLDLWERVLPGDSRYLAGSTNDEHLEFTGNNIGSGDPNAPLVYTFRISKGGTYQLFIRARKRLEGARKDLCNDCYVKIAGDFTSGNPKAALSALLTDTKLYGGDADGWGWAGSLDSEEADHTPAKYIFKAGETYTLTISGRSQRFNIDRIVLFHSDITRDWDHFINSPESQRVQ